MSAGNDDLHPILSAIHETVGEILEEVQTVRGEAVKLREAVVEGIEAIQDAIHDSVQAQAELQMMEHVAEVEAIEPQITAEQERIEAEEAELDDRLEQIAERYERRHAELDETAAERVRDLGSHIFEIDEEQFETGIEDPFTDHVTTTWASLQAHNAEVAAERQEAVELATGDVVESVHGFVDQQRQLLDRIAAHRTDLEVDGAAPTQVQVPYYVVEVAVDGRTEEHVVTPSSLTDGDGATGVELEPLAGIADAIEPTELAAPDREQMAAGSVLDAAAGYREDAPPLLSYGDELAKAIADPVAVVDEGGGS